VAVAISRPCSKKGRITRCCTDRETEGKRVRGKQRLTYIASQWMGTSERDVIRTAKDREL